MKKKSQFISLWPQIYQKLKNPPPGVNLGTLPSQLPPLNKIKIEPGRLPTESQAIGYVSTEDADQNGVLDTIHISSPRIEEALRGAGVSLESAKNLNQLSNEELLRILTPFVELLSHEIGHIKDYKHDQENPFPGGESVAETAARNATNIISTSTTNKESFITQGRSMKVKTLRQLVAIANHLDKSGNIILADQIDAFIEKYSQQSFKDMSTKPDLTPVSVKEPIDRLKESIKGNIRPKGDPYTYNFNADQTFTIVTTPIGKENLVNHIIKPGQDGYLQLLDEAKKLGLVKPQQQLSETESVVPAETNEELINKELNKLGLGSIDTIIPATLDPIILAKKSLFKQGVIDFINKVESLIRGNGPSQTSLIENLETLKGLTLNGRQVLDFYKKRIYPLLSTAIGTDNINEVRQMLSLTLDKWEDVKNILRLKSNIVARKGSTQIENLSDDKKEKEETDKVAELNNLFLIKESNPFFRSDERFTRR